MADKSRKSNLKKDELYQSLSLELQTIKSELINELKVSSVQIVSMYEGIKNASATSSSAIAQEIRYGYKQNQNIYEGVATLLKTEVAEKISAMSEQVSALELEALLNQISELKYSYLQLQSVYEGLASTVMPQVATLAEKSAMLDAAQATLQEISEKLSASAGIPEEAIKKIVEESVSVHSQEILDAVAANPVGDAIDYARVADVVGEKLAALLDTMKAESVAIDYERVAGDTAAKVVESLPYVEPVDYNRINDMIVAAVSAAVSVDAIADAVAAKMAIPAPEPIDVDAIADAVVAKMPAPAVETEEDNIDYDKLADLVVEKLAAKGMSADIILDEEGVDKIAETVVEKIGTIDNIDYDKVCLAAQAAQIIPDPVDYDRVAEIVEDKLSKSCDTIERVVMLDEEGVQKIVDGVAEELRSMTLVCEYEEIEKPAVEEPATEEVAEEPVVEETVEEEVAEEEPVVEETVEEPVVEEPVAEEPVVEEVAEEPAAEEPATETVDEIAAASDEQPIYEEGLDGELIDAETGLVIRLKRSFIAKMKQSDDKVKGYYSDLKNELTSYKRINSNVSWHGDRFNYGRETIAKIGINGKTLCFYLALDPNDPELKQTVYHQKDVGAQKAYESTPFMVKTKSDAALKKALRLVTILAEKLGAEKDEKFEAVDYTVEFSYESTKSLFEAGYIKATKEKKVDFNF